MYLAEVPVASPTSAILPSALVGRLRGARPTAWIGHAITFSLLVAVLWQLRALDPRQVLADVPASPSFWLVFAVSYAAAPVADWVIFRRVWRIPAEGLIALTRKFVGNELLVGYIGEAYFYTWARARAHIASAPFGAIKDVAVLSALAGNAVTLAMVAAAFPALRVLHLGLGGPAFLVSIGITLASSLAMMAFRKQLFGLRPRELWFVAAVHFARLTLKTLLTALMWHLVLPGQPLDLWVPLSALRLLLSRLPLLPNKDLVFAGLAILLMGHDARIATMMAMIASLTLATHVLAGLALIGADIARGGRA